MSALRCTIRVFQHMVHGPLVVHEGADGGPEPHHLVCGISFIYCIYSYNASLRVANNQVCANINNLNIPDRKDFL